MWFAESAWPTIVALAVIAGLGISAWSQNQRKSILLGVVVSLLLMPLVWWAERVIVTPRERVEQSVYDITSAFQQKDQDRTLSFISVRAKILQATVIGAMRFVDVGPDMRVTDVEIHLTNENSRAVSRFRVNATINSILTGGSQHYPSRWEANWQLEGGEWKMLDIVELDVISGKELHRLPNFSSLR